MEDIAASSRSSHTGAIPSGSSSALSEPLVTPDSKYAQAHQTFELEELPPASPRIHPRRSNWYTRAGKALGFYNPKVQRVWEYIRGPRPKVNLPDPVPLLGRTYHIRQRSYTIALEPLWIRATHPFRSPILFIVLVIGYIIGYAFFARTQSFLTPADSFIPCTAAYWTANDGCGLDGENCAPFDNSTFSFRCPAQCSSVILQNPRTVGDTQVVYVPLLVGGGDENRTYRGDSFVCAAAVQAGVISDSKGGCATLQLVGNYTNYLPFTSHGLTSIGFPSVFPLSFQFLSTTDLHHCEDLRNPALAFNVIITTLIFLVLRPKPIVAFWCLVCIGFWHVTLFSQPRGTPPPLDQAFATFLPALFICYGFWRVAWRFVLPTFRNSPIESTVWYVGPFWVTVLTNLTTDKLPIDRLLASDLRKRAGAITSLVIVVIVVFVIVVNQIRVIRKTGWLPHYAGWYIMGGLLALVLSQLPGLTFRLHHYIIGIVLMPGTGFPTRLSAIYQSFLLGLFLNGAAAWGFASILQTAQDLRRDAPLGSALPSFLTNSTIYNTSIPLQQQAVFWDALPNTDEGWDGFALLVDDVERYVGTALNFSLASLQEGIPHFLRLAYTNQGETGDFTMPAAIWPNGTWSDPLPGPS